jgi:hypothetical protein
LPASGRHLDLTSGSHVRASFREAVLARVVSTALLQTSFCIARCDKRCPSPVRSGLRAAMRMLVPTGATGERGFGFRSPPTGLTRPTATRRKPTAGGDIGSLVSVLGFRVDLQKSTESVGFRMNPPVVVAAPGRSCLARALERSARERKGAVGRRDRKVSATRAFASASVEGILARSSSSRSRVLEREAGGVVRFGVPLAARRATRDELRGASAAPVSSGTDRERRRRTRRG